jgi:hypothetical protein
VKIKTRWNTRIYNVDFLNATFNNISVISWRSVLLVEETGIYNYLWSQCLSPLMFEFHSWRGVQHYVIKFVSDFWQVGSFLPILRFPVNAYEKTQIMFWTLWCSSSQKLFLIIRLSNLLILITFYILTQ